MSIQNPTAEQQAIFASIPEDRTTSWIIEARAGSGKTSTMVALAPSLPANTRFLAFNKAIATELSSSLPREMPASTFHALGLSILRDRIGKFRVDGRKLFSHAKELGLAPIAPYTKIVEMAKTSGLGLPNFPQIAELDAWTWLIDTYDLEIPDGETEASFISKAQALMLRSLSDLKFIDFADMLYLPLHLQAKYRWAFDQYDLLVVDEAQDISPLRQALIEALTSRVIAVGDPYQAIYGFAGAMEGALSALASSFSASRLPLSCSFRCGSDIIAEAAQLIAPATILPRPNAHRGEVTRLSSAHFDPRSLNRDTMTLCRTNAPLFALAMRMLRARLPFEFRSDMPGALIKFVKRFKAKDLNQLSVRLEGWYDTEIPRLELAKRKGAIAAAHEKFETLSLLISEHEDIEGLMSTLDRLLRPDFGPILSTIHKSKGLEAKDVYLLRPDLLPAPFASEGWQLEQERNLHYVAVTRAINTFTYVDEV